jgi:hypothetical protein
MLGRQARLPCLALDNVSAVEGIGKTKKYQGSRLLVTLPERQYSRLDYVVLVPRLRRQDLQISGTSPEQFTRLAARWAKGRLVHRHITLDISCPRHGSFNFISMSTGIDLSFLLLAFSLLLLVALF